MEKESGISAWIAVSVEWGLGDQNLRFVNSSDLEPAVGWELFNRGADVFLRKSDLQSQAIMCQLNVGGKC